MATYLPILAPIKLHDIHMRVVAALSIRAVIREDVSRVLGQEMVLMASCPEGGL
jgi:hypothetical protein